MGRVSGGSSRSPFLDRCREPGQSVRPPLLRHDPHAGPMETHRRRQDSQGTRVCGPALESVSVSSTNLTLSNPAPRASVVARIAWLSPLAIWMALASLVNDSAASRGQQASIPPPAASPQYVVPPLAPPVRYDLESMPEGQAQTYLTSHMDAVFSECGVGQQRARVRATFGPRGLEDARLLTPRFDAACVSRALAAQRPPTSRVQTTYEVDLVRREQRVAPQRARQADPPAPMAAQRAPRRARRPERIW